MMYVAEMVAESEVTQWNNKVFATGKRLLYVEAIFKFFRVDFKCFLITFRLEFSFICLD